MTTVSPIPNTKQPAQPSFSVVEILTNSAMGAKFFAVTAAFAVCLAAFACAATVAVMKQRENVIILAQDGSMIYASTHGFSDAGELHDYHAKLATLALLHRNPNGPDHPDLLSKVFLEEAQKKAETYLKSSAEEYFSREIYQDVKISTINVIEVPDFKGYKRMKAHVAGQIIKSLTLKDPKDPYKKFRVTEPAEFTADFILLRNPDLMKNGRFPLSVFDFEIEEEINNLSVKPVKSAQ